MSVLDIDINAFENHRSQDNPRSVNLLKWLTSDWYFDQQKEIMNCSDMDIKSVLKSQMPCIMPSLHFGEHTGLIALDIDAKDNPGRNMTDIKNELSGFNQVAYCGQSVSGTGLWLLIPISDPDNHLYHFLALEKIMARLKIKIDPSKKNVNALRYYSHDPAGYFNHDAETFYRKYEPVTKERKHSNYKVKSEIDVISLLEKHGWKQCGQRGNKIDFTRPGKNVGPSGNIRLTDNIFYVFTSSTQFDPGKGYSPISVYAILEHGGDFSKAISTLKSNNN